MTIQIFGGGTVQHVRVHCTISASAYGGTARYMAEQLGLDITRLQLTKMADYRSSMETNEEVEARLLQVLADPDTRAIVFSVAVCDFAGQIGDIPSGKYAPRLSSREGAQMMVLTPTPKLLGHVKSLRPDVFLVGFKTTSGATQREQHRLALRQIEETGADIVFANDTGTRHNMMVFSHGFYAGSREEMMALLLRELRELP